MRNNNACMMGAAIIVASVLASCALPAKTLAQISGEAEDSEKPNFIFILADDLGWSSLSVPMHPAIPESGSTYFETPNLARLAQSGRRFTSGYAPAAICSPTRRSIQFGQSPARHGDEEFIKSHHPDNNRLLTIPLALKAVDPDYQAAHYGKWDLRADIFPEDLGYDESDGDTGNDNGDVMLDRDVKWSKVFLNERDPKRIRTLTRRGVNFIERQVDAGKPFYLQISHYATHVDIQAYPETYEYFREKPVTPNHDNLGFAAMLYDLDGGIGEILDAVEKLGITDNTYIIFMTDNGGVERIPPPSGNDKMHHPDDLPGVNVNAPLRGGKWVLYEGGVRVPFLVAGPGVPAGSSSDVPVIGYDLLPTMVDLAGGAAPAQASLDGGSFRQAMMTGNAPVERPFDGLTFHRYASSYKHSSLRVGNWKVVKRWYTGELELYNLADDIREAKDLSADYPEKAEELYELMMAHFEEIDAPFLAGVEP